jgi:hypothetical protein
MKGLSEKCNDTRRNFRKRCNFEIANTFTDKAGSTEKIKENIDILNWIKILKFWQNIL